MNSFSVKAKIFVVIITLSVFSLGIFGYLSLTTYKKDKLAFMYDYLTTEAQSNSMIFSSTIDNYDFLLGTIISGIDLKTSKLSTASLKYIQKNSRILGLYIHMPEEKSLTQSTLFESERWSASDSWASIEKAGMGLTLLDGKKGSFLLKKELSTPGAYAGIVFKQMELSDLLYSNPDRFNFITTADKQMSKEKLLIDPQELAGLKNSLKEINTPFGLFEANINGEKFFVAFSKLNIKGMTLINMIKESKVLLVQKTFLNQLILFLIMMVSTSLLIGTISARYLTWHLDVLTEAAHEMEKENFDVRVEVTNKDEFGTLGLAFNSMSERIKYLLEELRKYNQELELKVQERTLELQQLTDIQKAMLNSLGQGFVIVDKDYNVLPVYSKIAEDMFEVIPNESSPAQIIHLKEDEASSFKELYEMAFNQMLDFDDLAKLHPESLQNSKGQHIELKYAPILNSESQGLDYVLVIGTDKTAEIESMEKFKKEWSFSQMIQKVAGNRFSLNKIIHEALEMLKNCITVLEEDKNFSLREVQRYIHTMKGSFSYFHIEDITTKAHEFESYLQPYYDHEKCPEEIKATVLDKIMGIQVAIECYIDHYDNIIQFKEAAANRTISNEDLMKFHQFLWKHSPALAQAYSSHFYKTKINPFFQMYPSLIKDLGLKLNKQVKFEIEGGDVELPDGPWEELFQQFIHVVRNSMDHGIEYPNDRVAKGKSPIGTIRFKFERFKNVLQITLSDDGKGVDWKRIAEKDPTVTTEDEALRRIMIGGVSSKDEVSDVSGRGVGVSSLFSTVEKRGGKIKIINQLDAGMSIILQVKIIEEGQQKLAHTA